MVQVVRICFTLLRYFSLLFLLLSCNVSSLFMSFSTARCCEIHVCSEGWMNGADAGGSTERLNS